MRKGALAILGWSLAALSSAQFPFLRTLEIRPGQQRPAISCLVQDSLGLLWAGADRGVYRTDGEFIDVVLQTEGVGVTAMTARGPAVLVALENGIVLRCSSTSTDTLLADPRLKEHPVRSIVPLAGGGIRLGTYGAGVWTLHKGVLSKITVENGLPDDHVNGMAALPDGRTAVATDQGLAICSQRAIDQVYDEARGAPDNLVLAVCVTADGQVHAGSDRAGVFSWTPGNDTVVLLDPDWSLGPVRRLAAAGDLVWVGTEAHGVVLFDRRERDTRYRQPNDGAIEHVGTIFVDDRGVAWWCDHTERIHRADPSVLFIAQHEGSDLRTISAICVDGRDRIWFATTTGLYHHPTAFSEDMHLTRVPVDIDPRTPIVSLAAGDDGTVWAATFGSGLLAIDVAGRVRRFTVRDGLVNDNVLAVRAHQGVVWFATLEGVTKWNGRAFELVPGTEGFTFDVLPLSVDSILLATDGRGVVRSYGRDPVLHDEGPRTFYALIRSGVRQVWAAGPGTGLCRVDVEGGGCLGKDRPPFDGDLYALGSALGRILVFGSTGTAAFDPISGAWADLTARFGLQDLRSQLNVIATGPDGSLWFGCSKGMARIRPEEHHFDTHVPVVITGVLVGGVPTREGPRIRTTFDRNDVTIRFGGLHFEDPGAVRFEYQLDAGTVQRTRDREVLLSGLSPGPHRFRIRAFVGDPTIQPEWRIISLEVSPPWWRLPWVVVGMSLIFLGGIALLVRQRERRMRYRDRMEQEKVRFQLDALRSQVDPHFLFNSFNTLVDLIETDTERAVEHVDELSAFFRNILLVRDKELIGLREELDLLDTYFRLEQRRFGDAIALRIRVPTAAQNARVVPLTLQLLVENALKHNVGLVDEPLVIDIAVEDAMVVVTNPIRLRTTAPKSTAFGLDSIVKRYAALTSRKPRVERTDGRFTVHIPLIDPLP